MYLFSFVKSEAKYPTYQRDYRRAFPRPHFLPTKYSTTTIGLGRWLPKVALDLTSNCLHDSIILAITGRRPTVMRVNRNVDRGKRIVGVQDVSACMLTRSKLGYSLVDFDFRDGSCWYRQDPIAEKDLHEHQSAVEFAPQKDAQDKGIFNFP